MIGKRRAMAVFFCVVAAAGCGPGGGSGADADADDGDGADGQDRADPALDNDVQGDEGSEAADTQDQDMPPDRRFRLPVTVDAAGYERMDRPVELHVSFTQALESLITDVPQLLTIGLVESTDADACASFIRDAVMSLTVTQGAAGEI
jgi:hypothetical protein